MLDNKKRPPLHARGGAVSLVSLTQPGFGFFSFLFVQCKYYLNYPVKSIVLTTKLKHLIQ